MGSVDLGQITPLSAVQLEDLRTNFDGSQQACEISAQTRVISLRIESKYQMGHKQLFVIWQQAFSHGRTQSAEFNLMKGGRDQNGIAVRLLPIGDCVLGRSEKDRTRRAFLGVRGRHPYSHAKAQIQGLDGFLQLVHHRRCLFGSCTT